MNINYNEWDGDSIHESENFKEMYDSVPSKLNSNYFNLLMHREILMLSASFEIQCYQIPVLGSNSAKYDIKLIRNELIKHMDLVHDKKSFIV